MLKFSAIALISSSVALFGAYKADTTRKKPKAREEILQFLRFTKSEIKFGSVPVKNILSSFCTKSHSFSSLLSDLKSGKSAKSCVDEHLFVLEKDEREKFTQFLTNLGKSHFAQKEIDLCDGCIDFFSQKISASSPQDLSRASLYSKLGIVAGIAVAIILI